MPPSTHPLLRWRMARRRESAWASMRGSPTDSPSWSTWCSRESAARGPMTAGRGRGRTVHDRRGSATKWGWNWSTSRRRSSTCSSAVRSVGRADDAVRAALRRARARAAARGARRADAAPSRGASARWSLIAARAHGVATEQRPAGLLPAQAGRLPACGRRAGRGRRAAAGRGRGLDARRPTCTATPAARGGSTARALLARSTRWCGERAAVEAPVRFPLPHRDLRPGRKRVHGYYVLPFLLGDALVARVDLKADRAGWRLLVQSAWAESVHRTTPRWSCWPSSG